MMEGPTSAGPELKKVLIFAICLKARRTASSLRAEKGGPTISTSV
jgi:hypothetical protein